MKFLARPPSMTPWGLVVSTLITPKSAEGGGEQTKSLRFEGADGRQYSFRSIDKDPAAILPPELRGTVVARVVQDQISAADPMAPFVVVLLLTSTGVLHSEPCLVVLPRGNPRLGQFEAESGRMLGILEERPQGKDDTEDGFARALEIISSDKLDKKVQKGPENLVDARAFLSARLIDGFLGDWDRHRDQHLRESGRETLQNVQWHVGQARG